MLIDKQLLGIWCSKTVNILQISKENTEAQLDRIKKPYGKIKTPAALHLIDKAKDTMRSTLPLFDKAIQILKAQQGAK